VARRRLKRPPRRSAHLLNHRAHVSLAEAGIDRVAPKVSQDVKTMRDELDRDDARMDEAGRGRGSRGESVDEGDEAEAELEADEEEPVENGVGVKVPG